jgi:hypothetical protein
LQGDLGTILPVVEFSSLRGGRIHFFEACWCPRVEGWSALTVRSWSSVFVECAGVLEPFFLRDFFAISTMPRLDKAETRWSSSNGDRTLACPAGCRHGWLLAWPHTGGELTFHSIQAQSRTRFDTERFSTLLTNVPYFHTHCHWADEAR